MIRMTKHVIMMNMSPGNRLIVWLEKLMRMLHKSLVGTWLKIINYDQEVGEEECKDPPSDTR